MAIRLVHNIIVQIFRDPEGKRALFSEDEELGKKIITDFEQSNSGNVSIGATSTDTLKFGDVDAVKGLFLEVDQDVDVKLNGGSEILPMRLPNTEAGATAKLFVEADISAVEITVPGATAMTGVYVAWGDPTP